MLALLHLYNLVVLLLSQFSQNGTILFILEQFYSFWNILELFEPFDLEATTRGAQHSICYTVLGFYPRSRMRQLAGLLPGTY